MVIINFQMKHFKMKISHKQYIMVIMIYVYVYKNYKSNNDSMICVSLFEMDRHMEIESCRYTHRLPI